MKNKTKVFLGRNSRPRKARRGTIVFSMTLGMSLVSVMLVYIMKDVKKERIRIQLSGAALEVAIVMKRFDHAVHIARTNPDHPTYALLRAAINPETDPLPGNRPITAVRFPLAQVRTEIEEEIDMYIDGIYNNSSIWRIGHGDKVIKLFFCVGDLDNLGLATGIGVLDVSDLSLFEQDFFFRQLLNDKQMDISEIFFATDKFHAVDSQLPDADSRTIILSHWFSDLDERFIFREIRARTMPNQMRSNLTLKSVSNAVNVIVREGAIDENKGISDLYSKTLKLTDLAVGECTGCK